MSFNFSTALISYPSGITVAVLSGSCWAAKGIPPLPASIYLAFPAGSRLLMNELVVII